MKMTLLREPARAIQRHRSVDRGDALALNPSNSGTRAERGGRQTAQYEHTVKR
jgi:hypothetical protein